MHNYEQVQHDPTELTEASDKLPALSGIAQRFTSAMEVDHSSCLAEDWRGSLP